MVDICEKRLTILSLVCDNCYYCYYCWSVVAATAGGVGSGGGGVVSSMAMAVTKQRYIVMSSYRHDHDYDMSLPTRFKASGKSSK